MHIKKGFNRFVFVFPSFGFVVKFPRIYLWWFLKDFGKLLFKRKWRWIRRHFSYSIESYGSWKRGLFKGIKDNWDEFKFYQQTKHVVVEPTYFSLFGFMNVQRYGPSQKIDFRAMGRIIVDVIGEDGLMRDGHHLINSDNFSFRDNKMRFRDYGSLKTRDVITDLGYAIFEKVDIKKLIEEHERVKHKPLIE